MVCELRLKTTSKGGLAAFLASECGGALEPKRGKGCPSAGLPGESGASVARAHGTHDLASRGDVIICTRCGSFTCGRGGARLVVRGLGMPCMGTATKAGLDALPRWRRGRHPSAAPPVGA